MSKKIMLLLLLSGCVTIIPHYPAEFEDRASKQQFKKILEWGSITRLEGSNVIFDKVKIEWSKGNTSTSGFKVGKFGKQGKEQTQPYSFSLIFQREPVAQVNCDTEIRVGGHGYGKVWSESEERKIACTIKQGTLIFKLRLKSSHGVDFSGELIGNGVEIEVRPNLVDSKGKEYGSPLAWDMFNEKRLIASLWPAFEPTYMSVEIDKRLMMLAAAIAGAISLGTDV